MSAPVQPPSNALIRKLEHYTRLSEEDRAAALGLCGERVQRFRAKDDLVREGEAPRVVRIVLDGWACRYKYLEDGRRQVVGLFLPGDICDLNVFLLREMDHFIGAVTSVAVAQVTRDAFEALTLAHPRLLQALWWETLVNMAIQREWLMNLGSRTAFERIAHLMCELYLRLGAAGRTQGLSCEWPLTQAMIADITGLSTVHVNRTFQAVREEGLVEVRDRVLTIRDLDALMQAALFSPNYLHLGQEGRHLDANDGAEAALTGRG
ncbi:cAMP-binding protein [Rubellimicrobium mesophilum DSM 19309]|uniref:cAMP-binding protein n=1 Tax=Rubellimicrobium mesophilum DSM 19309 TaxID=442562 RepID=A0A017HR22_9RHOB|nr:Crp/Fnr family transcriptional regulator [Rubellimicrobium mesophilum]EYD76942.1 cAMP-binding protein [Rubellimicrobium mesophilum DSM 19309]